MRKNSKIGRNQFISLKILKINLILKNSTLFKKINYYHIIWLFLKNELLQDSFRLYLN